MKKIIALVAAFGVVAVSAAPFTQSQPAAAPYVVQSGDNLWNLAKVRLQDPRKWEKLIELNPYLKAPGRVFTKADGTDVVLIKPGEKLKGLEELGITLTEVRPQTLMDPIPAPTPNQDIRPSEDHHGLLTWLPWILLGLALWALFRKQNPEPVPTVTQAAANNDPATAGPPMVPGGITDTNADEALRSVAARQFGGPVQNFTVLSRTAGRVYGQMLVSYADGTNRTWQLSGQQAWRARVRLPNGHEETVYMLQACGNDLRFGGVERYHPSSGFRFVEDEPVVSQAPAVATPVSAPQTTTDTVPDGTIKVEVKPSDNHGPNLVKVTGIDPIGASVTLKPDGFELRYVAPFNKSTQPSTLAA